MPWLSSFSPRGPQEAFLISEMTNFLMKFLGGSKEPRQSDEPVERFGRTFVKRSRGVELLGGCRKRKAWIQGIRDHINIGSQYPKEILIDRVLGRFAMFVGDLSTGSSEKRVAPAESPGSFRTTQVSPKRFGMSLPDCNSTGASRIVMMSPIR